MRFFSLILIAALNNFAFAVPPSVPDPADTVYTGGNVYTVNERQPRAEAIAIKGGRIVFVGSNSAGKAFVGKGTKVIDLKGTTVVPGLTDSHYHLMGVGAREMNRPGHSGPIPLIWSYGKGSTLRGASAEKTSKGR